MLSDFEVVCGDPKYYNYDIDYYNYNLKNLLIFNEKKFSLIRKPSRVCGSTTIFLNYIVDLLRHQSKIPTKILLISPTVAMSRFVHADLVGKLNEEKINIIANHENKIISNNNKIQFHTHTSDFNLMGMQFDLIIDMDVDLNQAYFHIHLYYFTTRAGRLFIECEP